MATFHLEIVTPESRVFDADAAAVTLPVEEGEIQILPGHIPLLTRLVTGAAEVILATGEKEYLAVGEGFARITPYYVALLTDDAIRAHDVNEIELEEARRKAQARLQEHLSAEEHASVSAVLARVMVQLRVKRRQQRGGPA